MIQDHYLAVKQWSPNFNPVDPCFGHTLVWIRFSALNVLFYHESALRTIASAVGKPVKVDVVTTNGDRGKFARVCVEVDLSKPVVKRVKVEDQWQTVEYASLQLICGRCNCYGHAQRDCSIREEVSMNEKAKAVTAEKDVTTAAQEKVVEENPEKPAETSISNQQNPINDSAWIPMINRRNSRAVKNNEKGKNITQFETRVQGKGASQRAWAVTKDHVNGMQTSFKSVGPSSTTNVEVVAQPKGQSSQVSVVKPNHVVKGGRFMFTSKQALKLTKVTPPKGCLKRARPSSLNTSPVQQLTGSMTLPNNLIIENATTEGREEVNSVIQESLKDTTLHGGST